MKKSTILTKKSLSKFDPIIFFVKRKGLSWKIEHYLMKMSNKLDGVTFDHFGESLKLLKKITKQMRIIEELQEEEVEGYVCSPFYLIRNYRKDSSLLIQLLFIIYSLRRTIVD